MSNCWNSPKTWFAVSIHQERKKSREEKCLAWDHVYSTNTEPKSNSNWCTSIYYEAHTIKSKLHSSV